MNLYPFKRGNSLLHKNLLPKHHENAHKHEEQSVESQRSANSGRNRQRNLSVADIKGGHSKRKQLDK